MLSKDYSSERRVVALAVQRSQLNSETGVELQREVQSRLCLNFLIPTGMFTRLVINGLLHFQRLEHFERLERLEPFLIRRLYARANHQVSRRDLAGLE